MSAVTDLLSECSAAGVELYLDNDRLRYRARAGVYTEALRRKVAACREELIAELAQQTTHVTPDLTHEDRCQRFKVTLKSGQVLLHSQPGGLTRGEAIELSKDWGEVAECVPAEEAPMTTPPVKCIDPPHKGAAATPPLASAPAKYTRRRGRVSKP